MEKRIRVVGLPPRGEVFVLVDDMRDDPGTESDWHVEVFSKRPTFALEDGQHLFVGNIDGGDSLELRQ